MLKYLRPSRFIPVSRRRITILEQQLVQLRPENFASVSGESMRRLSPLPLAVMGFLKGVFGETGEAIIRMDGLIDTVLFEPIEVQSWLVMNSRDIEDYPEMLDYYNPSGDPTLNLYPFKNLVPDLRFIQDHMDSSQYPNRATFIHKTARLHFDELSRSRFSGLDIRLS